jgi:hypothetical protein
MPRVSRLPLQLYYYVVNLLKPLVSLQNANAYADAFIANLCTHTAYRFLLDLNGSQQIFSLRKILCVMLVQKELAPCGSCVHKFTVFPTVMNLHTDTFLSLSYSRRKLNKQKLININCTT